MQLYSSVCISVFMLYLFHLYVACPQKYSTASSSFNFRARHVIGIYTIMSVIQFGSNSRRFLEYMHFFPKDLYKICQPDHSSVRFRGQFSEGRSSLFSSRRYGHGVCSFLTCGDCCSRGNFLSDNLSTAGYCLF